MEKMTLFYSENTGEIKLCVSGDVDFNVFCGNEADMRSFCKRTIIDRNDEIMKNSHEYIIDLNKNILTKKQIEVKEISIKI